MKRVRTSIIATAVLAVATMAFAQAKPDFSGTWAPEADAAAGAGGGGGGRGMAGPMTVKQTATDLTVEREGRNGKTSTTYKLDGSETKAGEFATTQTWSLDAGVLTIDSQGGRGPSTRKYKKTT
jgi:hypothetical protein